MANIEGIVTKDNSLIVNNTDVNKNQKVEIVWDEELQKWIPEIVDIINDVETGDIKTTWKTHLIWILITILSIVGTYYFSGTKTTPTPTVTPVTAVQDSACLDCTPVDSVKIVDTVKVK